MDEGIGISPTQLAGLFRPFTQADSSTTRRYGGTGLGLVVSQNLVGAMGGRIEVDSVEGEGSTFHFRLCFRCASGSLTPRPGRTPGPAKGALSGARILVVEDNELNREFAVELLEANGLKVVTADNGEEALRALDQSEFDGVLMDCQMPVMDGFEATARIRAQARLHELPVIAMTANALKGDRGQALAAGMNDHVPKPVDVRHLLEVLGRWIRPRTDVGPGHAPD